MRNLKKKPKPHPLMRPEPPSDDLVFAQKTGPLSGQLERGLAIYNTQLGDGVIDVIQLKLNVDIKDKTGSAI